jgi:hypothetical protein
MQIGQIQRLLPGTASTPTPAAPAAPQTAADFQAIAMQQLGLSSPTGGTASTIASSLISLLSEDDSSTDSTDGSASLTSLLGTDDSTSQASSTEQLQEPPDSANALLLQAQLGL